MARALGELQGGAPVAVTQARLRARPQQLELFLHRQVALFLGDGGAEVGLYPAADDDVDDEVDEFVDEVDDEESECDVCSLSDDVEDDEGGDDGYDDGLGDGSFLLYNARRFRY